MDHLLSHPTSSALKVGWGAGRPLLVFFGTPKFAVRILDILEQHGLAPALVITTPDKPGGRGKKLLPPPTKIWAEARKIDIWQPEKLHAPEFLQKMRDLSPDLFLVASYGKIMPQELLDIPRSGTLNIHPSLLPLYRGPAPIEGAILSGDKETGVTIMLVDAEMDHGPILAQEKLPEPIADLKFAELETRLADLGGRMLTKTIPSWLDNKITPHEQDHAGATITKKITKEDGRIDWQTSAEQIRRRILALNPWPGTYSFIDRGGNQERLIISEATLLPNTGDQKRQRGEIFAYEKSFAVATGDGALLIWRVKPEGKNEMTATEYLRGHKEFLGKIWE
ncbi:MAG: methionyl-tRNA formyltransferase [Candidatus Niyogibacteria bacterium]|nr:methionyl-tRNA formyltransferase [Candidatus Niyogibacteria bacterium]